MNKIIAKTSFLEGKIPLKQRMWHIEHNRYSLPVCLCGTVLKWNAKDKTYRRYCSSKCANNDPLVKEKREKTCLAKYGHKTNLSADSNKQKQKQTLLDKYGVDNFAKTKQFKEQYVSTCIERHGVSNTSKLEATQKKIDATHEARYGRKRRSQIHIPEAIIATKNNKELMEHWFNELKMPVTEIAKILGVNHSQLCVHFRDNLGIDITRHQVSTVERQINEYIQSLGVTTEQSNRTLIKPKELDIIIPVKKLAIEVNGVAWHSELRGKDKTYHLNKMNQCNALGYRLVQILDCEWNSKEDLVKSRISGMLGKNNRIFARKCTIIEVTATEATKFFNDNHIQGMCVHNTAYGLSFNGTLVAVMSFGKSRYAKRYEWELLRFANIKYTNVIGGASRLLAHFIKNKKPLNIVSYCDLRWNTGNLYSTIGFTKISQSGPNYWYTKNYTKIESRIRYQKHKLKDALISYDPANTEWENMVNNGYDRIWDCGNAVYLWD